jgi:hypothetical protein
VASSADRAMDAIASLAHAAEQLIDLVIEEYTAERVRQSDPVASTSGSPSSSVKTKRPAKRRRSVRASVGAAD